ncbi:MAG: immunoglobulin domain-containing protein, partial [Verrucomicrobiota bacterium]
MLFALPVAAAGGQTLRGHIPAAVAGLQPIGPLAGTNRLNLAISLPLRDADGLGQLLKQIYDPASANFRHYLTPAQFTDQFGPTVADYEAVKAFAKTNGLTVSGEHPNRMLLDVSGAVADVERAFHVKMQVYQHPTEARTFYAPDSEPSLDLATPVLHVSGLENYSLPRPRMVVTPLVAGQKALPNAGSGLNGTYMGKDFRAAYVPDTTMTGSGQTVGLLQFDGYTTSDIAYYESLAGLPNVPLTNVLLDGFSGHPTGYGGEVEVSLDIEMSISMAPGLSGVLVYEAGPYGNWYDILNRMATDNLAKQLSSSWYIPDGGPDATAEQIFQEMAAQGQSFYEASGDYDAYTGLIPFPGDSPNITQVGGTTLTTSGPGGSWVSETVWNRNNGIGSGGGISTYYPIPSYQTNISMAASQGSTTQRNTPDVALTADNVYVRADGWNFAVGGTSCAAPLWAGFTALCNQRAVMSGRPTVGFINPALDTIGSGGNYALCFHDITTGNNTSMESPNQFYAVSGYDLCTGWGVPAGQNLIVALATPDPLGILPDTGFTAVGGSGGPFTVTAEGFVLTNSGTTSLDWSMVNTSLWLTVSPTGGTLAAGGFDGTPLVSLGATAYSLPIGNYTAVVAFSNISTGIAQNRQFALQVVPSVPPTIVTQPTNQTVFVGFTAAFSVTADGTPPLAYQWQINGTNINGATNALLTLTNASFSEAGSYSVTVTNTLGATNSSNAVLTVNPPPPCAPVPSGLISWWPAEGNANDLTGLNDGFLTNGASFGPGEVGQAFLLNGINQYVVVPDSPSLRPASVTVEGWLNFRSFSGLQVFVAKPYGSGTLDSFAVWETSGQLFAGIATAGGNQPFLDYYWAPAAGTWHHVAYTFDANASYQTLYVDGAAVASGASSGPMAYDAHPFQIGADIENGSPAFFFDGEIDETSIYNRALTGEEIASIYAAAFTGKCPPAPTPPTIVAQPQSQDAVVGGSVTFAVTAKGTQPLSYQWTFNTTNIGNATNSSLTLTNLALTNSGTYVVTVSNALASVVSSNATLTVSAVPPTIVTQPINQTVVVGFTTSFAVTAEGTSPLSYQWTFNTTNIGNATNASLTLTNVQFNQAGSYAVQVSNTVGSVTSSNALLSVTALPPPTIVTQPQSQTVVVGTNVTFSVTTAGLTPTLPSVNSGTLRLWLKADAGVVTNAAGQVSLWQDQS